ncbi:uncharacterized protein Dvar_32970 [Desulfosarcina variabilis str. Montpellier]|uniref:DUF4124 domain-containing protein n=1 Tax=Desulfosarcina variabilis TaxID=2300 RepID=UPI003AFA3B32
MKKIVIVCLAIILLPMLTSSLSARIYKYIDENGQKRWTDDLSQVPVEQRESAEHFESVGDASQDASSRQEKSKTDAEPEADQPSHTVELTRESLLNEKSELEKQYQQIVEERKQIEDIKAQKGDATDRKELRERISAYNAKTEQYEMRLEAYKEKVDAYKKKIMPANEVPAQ